jgi:hypothetical protein
MLDNNTALMMQAACATNNEELPFNKAKAVPMMMYHCQRGSLSNGDNNAADCHQSFDPLHGMQ